MFASRRITAVAAAASLATLGFVGFGATSALAAAPTPCAPQAGAPNNGSASNQQAGDCTITGTVKIETALTFASNLTGFTLDDANPLNTPNGGGTYQVSSNDQTGWYISQSASTPDGFPLGDVSSWQVNNGSAYAVSSGCPTMGSSMNWTPLSSSPVTLFIANEAGSGHLLCSGASTGGSASYNTAGDDTFDVPGFELTSVGNTSPQTYQITVQTALWGQ